MLKCFSVGQEEFFIAGIHNFKIVPKKLLLGPILNEIGGKNASFDNLIIVAKDSIIGEAMIKIFLKNKVYKKE
jgi:hypothetical protein